MLDDSIPMSFVMSAGLVQVEQSLSRARVRDKDKFVLVQDCFRHFDLERVGMGDIHLSFFKMPGAFKFSANGKVETIHQMWHLVTSILGIAPDHLWASYFAGDMVEGTEFEEDTEVYQTWRDVGLPDARIVGLPKKDNFWLQGNGFNNSANIRKSGPNTELFYDRGIEYACGPECKPGCKCGRFIEFANSLFIRYEIDPQTNAFSELQNPFSETVIGYERVAMILQHKESVFDIDIYEPLMTLIRQSATVKEPDIQLVKTAGRIIADHLRALAYLIADGAPPPGKNGRQRLVKKLLRGLMTGMQILEIEETPFLKYALDVLILSDPQLESRKAYIEKQFLAYYSMQNTVFEETIRKGKSRLENCIRTSGAGITGTQMLLLEKKYGLPYLLLIQTLKSHQMDIPEKEYHQAVDDWKNHRLNLNVAIARETCL